MTILKISSLALTMTALLGCAAEFQEISAKHQEALRKRAAFDLNCPAEQLQLQPLDDRGKYDFPRQYGVTGCGHRAAYVNTDPSSEKPNWVLDSTTTRPPENTSEKK